MIQINLLDGAEGKGAKKSRGPRKPRAPGGGLANLMIVLAVLGAIAVSGGIFAYGVPLPVINLPGFLEIQSAKKTKAELKSKHEKIEKDLEELSAKAQRILKQTRVLESRKEIYAALDPPNRILWSQKLAMLSDLIPSTVFIKRIRVVDKVTMVETPSSRRANKEWQDGGRKEGEKPKTLKKPAITYTFTIDGIATGDDSREQMNNTMGLFDAMKAYETTDAHGEMARFMDGFGDPEFTLQESAVYEGIDVWLFSMFIETRAALAEQ